LKNDLLAFRHIQFEIIRCRPCCYIVHLLLARAGDVELNV